ncbi:GAF domain-containing protein [Streptomyces sp. bgisy032]|uniref:GAF domain-containing protein n=1 Tax=Streptomyces sp. bgisy032 TaxID=3413773 RepID=UPI003D74928B
MRPAAACASSSTPGSRPTSSTSSRSSARTARPARRPPGTSRRSPSARWRATPPSPNPPGRPSAQAARDVSQVTIREVESDPALAEPARTAILAAGSRACHSVPLTTDSGQCVGVVSAHMDRPLRGLTETQTKALGVVGTQAGRWLAWHDRTVVLDALEHLHALGRARRGSRHRRL